LSTASNKSDATGIDIGAPAPAPGILASIAGWRRISGPLFRKYVGLFLAVVCVALLSNGLFEILFSYREHTDALIRIQREQAEGAAEKIAHFIKEIENQIGWTTQLTWSASTIEQRRFDGLRLLRQVPAITELAQLDPTGKEQLRVSRLVMDLGAAQTDYSQAPKFTEAVAKKVYYGPVYFRRESEPYMTLSLAGTRRDAGVSVAEVNLKLIWDVVSQIKVGERGVAYVVDGDGRLIAHPDISLVLRNTDMTRLAQVAAARSGQAGPVQEAEDLRGGKVLSAYAPVSPLGWLVFVELPVEEAYASLYNSIKRSGLIMFGGLMLAFLAGLLLARRMVVPIQMLRAGAQRIGGGDLGQRISIKTGDELEGLADQFNDMANRLQESYSGLERKVEMRTRELAQSVEELRALGEVSQAVNSTLDVQTVLDTIVAKAVQLSATDAGTIFVFNEAAGEFEVRANYGMSEELIAAFQQHHDELSDWLTRATALRQAVQDADLRDPSVLPQTESLQKIVVDAGYLARIFIPLLGADRIVGALVVRRKAAGEFPKSTIDLLQTFAAQSVLAIQNARLFQEIQVKSHELEIASQHKSQFLANMSHELRTPLNAILGYTELVLDKIYGDVPEKMRSVLERVQSNGKHLLGLINDVLDLSKIEAGQLKLSLEDYSIRDVVHSVFTLVEPLAEEKHLALKVELPDDLPVAHGDERRLTQVVLNLVGNAIKFTDAGEVVIRGAAANGHYTLSVQDTGPGISPSDQVKIFEEFQQADGSSTKVKGGTGLGLSIAKRIVNLHGGRIWVSSEPGSGSTFFIDVPIKVEQQAGHA
jgi:signal transduction histidine kinase